MSTIQLDKTGFLTKIANYETTPEWKYLGDRPAIVDFYADWCGPCKTLSPILDELSEEYKNQIYIYKVNTEEELELSELFNIRSIPTILLIPMNEEPQMGQGAVPKHELKGAIDQFLLKKP